MRQLEERQSDKKSQLLNNLIKNGEYDYIDVLYKESSVRPNLDYD